MYGLGRFLERKLGKELPWYWVLTKVRWRWNFARKISTYWDAVYWGSVEPNRYNVTMNKVYLSYFCFWKEKAPMCKAHQDATARYHPNYTPEKGISLKENNGFPPLHATRGRAVSHTPLASYLRSDFPWAYTIRPLSMRKIRPTPLGHSV